MDHHLCWFFSKIPTDPSNHHKAFADCTADICLLADMLSLNITMMSVAPVLSCTSSAVLFQYPLLLVILMQSVLLSFCYSVEQSCSQSWCSCLHASLYYSHDSAQELQAENDVLSCNNIMPGSIIHTFLPK